MEPYIYEPMKAEDAKDAAEIEQQIFSRPWTRENFVKSIRHPDTIYLAARKKDTGILAGYCGCYQSLDEGNITNVAVKPSMQGQGIGRNLLQQMLQAGRQKGIRTFVLEVRTSNSPAIRLYESLGFQTAGIRKGFYTAPVEDAYIMIL